MFFMRFAIDALFLDQSARVVRAAERLRPWVLAAAARRTDSVLELPVGAIARSGTQVGDEIVWEPVAK